MRYSLEKKGLQGIRVQLFWNKGLKHLMHMTLRSRNMTCRACMFFHCVVVSKVFKSSLDLYFCAVIIGFFWYASLRFKIEQKMHTKAVYDRSRGYFLSVLRHAAIRIWTCTEPEYRLMKLCSSDNHYTTVPLYYTTQEHPYTHIPPTLHTATIYAMCTNS